MSIDIYVMSLCVYAFICRYLLVDNYKWGTRSFTIFLSEAFHNQKTIVLTSKGEQTRGFSGVKNEFAEGVMLISKVAVDEEQ